MLNLNMLIPLSLLAFVDPCLSLSAAAAEPVMPLTGPVTSERLRPYDEQTSPDRQRLPEFAIVELSLRNGEGHSIRAANDVGAFAGSLYIYDPYY